MGVFWLFLLSVVGFSTAYEYKKLKKEDRPEAEKKVSFQVLYIKILGMAIAFSGVIAQAEEIQHLGVGIIVIGLLSEAAVEWKKSKGSGLAIMGCGGLFAHFYMLSIFV